MSRTTRRHDSPGRHSKRGPTGERGVDKQDSTRKTVKQKRSNERAKLRKEFK